MSEGEDASESGTGGPEAAAGGAGGDGDVSGSAQGGAATAATAASGAKSGGDGHETDTSVDSSDSSEGGVGLDVDDVGEEDSSDEEEGKTEILDVEFEFYDPRPIDYLSVKRFLTNYLPGSAARSEISAGKLAQSVLDQVSVGTMVKIKDDPDVYAFSTVLNMHTLRDHASVKYISAFLLKHAPDTASRAALQAVLNDARSNRLGLLLNDRLVNVPPDVVPPLLSALCDDLQWAAENEETSELRDAVKYGQYLLVARCFRDKKSETPGALGYYRFEEELLEKRATLAFTLSPPKEAPRKEYTDEEVRKSKDSGAAEGGAGSGASGAPQTEDSQREREREVRRLMVVPASALAEVADEAAMLLAGGGSDEAGGAK